MATERTADNRKLIGYLSSGALVLGTLMPVTIFYSGPMPMGSAILAHGVFGWLVIGCAAAAAYFVYHDNYERVTLATAGAVLVCRSSSAVQSPCCRITTQTRQRQYSNNSICSFRTQRSNPDGDGFPYLAASPGSWRARAIRAGWRISRAALRERVGVRK